MNCPATLCNEEAWAGYVGQARWSGRDAALHLNATHSYPLTKLMHLKLAEMSNRGAWNKGACLG